MGRRIKQRTQHDLYKNYPSYKIWRVSIINAFAAVGIGSPVNSPSPKIVTYLATSKKKYALRSRWRVGRGGDGDVTER